MRKLLLLFSSIFFLTTSNAQLLTESFDAATFPPTGWTNTAVVGGATDVWARATTTINLNAPQATPHSGAAMALYDSYTYASGNIADLATPSLNMSSGGPYRVRFWMFRDQRFSLNDDSLEVFINTAGPVSSGGTKLGRVSRHISDPPAVASRGWYEYTFNIPGSFNGATNYVIFKATSRYGTEMVIDDVVVEAQPSCGAPATISVSSVTNTSVNFNWTTGTGAIGYEWAVTASATPPASGTATVSTSASQGGLTAATQYYIHVRTACAGGVFSAWATLPFLTAIDCSAATNITGCGVSQTAVIAAGTGVYSNNACGFSTPGIEQLYTFTPTITGSYTLNITSATGGYIDYMFKDAAGGCGPTGWTCIDDNNAAGTDVFGPLTAGTTYYILLDPEGTAGMTHTFDLTCPAAAPPACTTNLTPANGATNVSPVTLTWNTTAGATSYDVYFGTTNPPTTLIGNTTGTTANITGTTAGTTYYWYIAPRNTAGAATGCDAGTFSFTTAAAPVNDTVCGAIALTQGGPQDCKNTTTATSVGDPGLPGGCSTPNNTVWYTYTPATNGTVILRTEIPGATTDGLDGWVAWYTATGTCPSLTLTAVAGSACQEFGQTGAGDVDSLTSPVLTAGVTYYIMIDGFSGDAGDFCISLLAPPPPPPCTTNIAPADGATGVTSVAGGVPFSWNAAAGATSYDVYFGTTNPPTTLIGNTTGTTATINGTFYNTTYYWYVVPKNLGGPATGCVSNTTSFTTENPTNCTPSYGTGCSLADSLIYFSLKGGAGSVIYNNSSATCNTTPVAYSDYTSSFTPVNLTIGETFGGFMRTGDPNDYATIWIDGNNDGYFDDSERLLDNLKIGTTAKLYSIYIPTTMPLGNHRMRVRIVYYSSAPTALTHPCNPYTYGETEDYTVNITNVGTSRTVAAGTPGSCITVSETTVGPASNNQNAARVFLLDSLNNYVAGISPNGNDWGKVSGGVYVHNAAVRQTPGGRYYLDRNINIATEKLSVFPYSLRYFYLNSELNALIAQPGSGVTSQFDLVMTKTEGIECVTQYVNQTPTFYAPTGFGSISGDRFLDFTNVNGFSRYFLHGGSTALVPITLTDFRGAVTGNTNTLYWTTQQEQNNNKFVVERSLDGRSFEVIGETLTRALNGNSSTPLNYSFVDASPVNGKTYYRLRIVDRNDRQAFSPIVTLLRGKGQFEIVDVRPNPTTGNVYFNLVGSSGGTTVVVRSMNGVEVMRKQFTQPSNFSINMSALANGLYILEATDRNGEKATFKITKQ